LPDARGFTSIHVAALANNVNFLRIALKLVEDARDRTTPTGDAPVDVAIRYRRDQAAEWLLAHGATMRADVPAAWPPLHEAARMDDIDRLVALLGFGADPHRMHAGVTPLDVAKKYGSVRAIEALRSR
jgi:ankyrin repeat protein